MTALVVCLQVLHGQQFNGFNAVVGDLQLGQVAYYSNRAGEPPKLLDTGLHGEIPSSSVNVVKG